MSFRVTLDRSIFHGESFDQLVNGSLRRACRSGRIAVYHTPILIEETLNLWSRLNQRERVRDQLKFITDIGNGRWFRQTGEIWTREFEGKSEKERTFYSRRENQTLIDNLRDLSNGGEFEKNEFLAAMAEKEINFQKALGLRKTLVSMREEIAKERKTKAGWASPWDSFEQYYDLNWEHCGTEMIRKHLRTDKDSEEAIKMWVQNPSRYIYFTLWIKALLYANYYARVDHNAPIDRHTQMDISLLVMARDLDAVISNDLAFMKSAFQALYGLTKEYLTLEQFLARLEQG